jgi:hypothetical protein
MLIRLLILALLSGSLVSCAQEKQGEEWVKPSEVQPQSTPQSKLNDNQLRRIKKLQASLADVDDSSLDKWVEDFEKDRDPEREILIWEAMAQAYQSYSSKHSLSPKGKAEVLDLLLLRSGTTSETAIKKFEPKVLTAREVRDVVEMYTRSAEPITVERK